MFINYELIKPNTIENRKYQNNIALTSEKDNTLVVLPTGLGKTIIALILISKFLKNEKNKILFLAPTKPLVIQHNHFLKEFLTINNNLINIFTGEISPEKRKNLWEQSKIIVSTPQVIENDLLSKRFDLKDVSFIIFDECHHAVGEYSYVFVSEMYQKQRENGRILGMTASPGNDILKILEVCKNLNIKNIEIRTKYDPDVRPYVHDLEITWREIPLPKDFNSIIEFFKKALSERLKILKDMELIESASVALVNRTNLLDAQKKIQTEIKSTLNPSKMLFKAASIQSEAMKIYYALELLQTQGVNALINYYSRIGKGAFSKKGSKASKTLVYDKNFLEGIAYAKSLNIEHPKVNEISKIVEEQFKFKKESKIIIFTHYRDTSLYLSKFLEKINFAKPARFIGQALKNGDRGLTQKEQSQIIQKFKDGEFNILIATSVAEEGLDIPSTDLVVFYEPIPSEIRAIQRRGRTARKMPGKVIILITKNTPDEGYYWAAKRKEKQMRIELELIRSKLKNKFEKIENIYNNQIHSNNDQKTLKDFNEKESDIKIIVDNREYRSSVVKNLINKGISIEPQQLDTGDYILSSRIGVERKEVDDFLNSLIDGKLFKQLTRLRDAYSRPLLLLEGDDLFTKRNINHNAIYGTLASITVDYGISILTTKNSYETADLLNVIAKREQREEKKPVAVRGKKTQMSLRERQQFFIEGLPNVSAIIAKRLLTHFGSIKEIANASEKELLEVKGIGRNIANDIITLLNTDYLEK